MRAWDLTFKQSLSLPTPPSRVALRSFAASFLVSRFFLSFLLRFSSVSPVFSPFPSSVLFPFFSFFLSELGGRGCEFARLSCCCPAACSLVCLPDSVIGVVFRDVVVRMCRVYVLQGLNLVFLRQLKVSVFVACKSILLRRFRLFCNKCSFAFFF